MSAAVGVAEGYNRTYVELKHIRAKNKIGDLFKL